jgi:hypothetical protein
MSNTFQTNILISVPQDFGHGTGFKLVSVYGKCIFFDPSFIKKIGTMRSLSNQIHIKIRIRTLSQTMINYAKFSCNKKICIFSPSILSRKTYSRLAKHSLGKDALDLQYIFRVLCPQLIQLCFSHSKHCVMLKWTAYVWVHCTWQWMGPSPSEEASRLAVAWLSPRANTCKRCAPSMGRPSARIWERAKM